MHLLLGQLVYTSFAEMGLRTLASAQISKEIQQALIQRIASKHWDSYSPPKKGYRAVYLHQVNLEQTLFGWFYNDEVDDIGRIHVPYFICYYLAEPLLDSQLEIIFTCLYKGPLALVDRQNPPASLKDLVISDLNYQPVRPGVKIPSDIRQHSHIALKQEQLLDLFIPVDEPQMVTKLNEQTSEQQEADFSVGTRLVENKKTGTATLNEDAAVEVEAQSRQSYQEKLQEYEYILVEAVQREYPISNSIRNLLKSLQQVWKLRDEDTKLIEARIVQQRKVVQPLEKRTEIIKSQAIAYRSIQWLLGIGITATFLALASSIYGLLQTSLFAPTNWTAISGVSSPVFYEVLAQVPNVPQGLFNYGGSPTFAPWRSIALDSAINQAQPQFRLRYTQPVEGPPNSSIGIKMLLGGELSFAESSRPLKDMEFAQAKQRGFTLEQVPVAIDGIAFYVNPQVSIPGISLSQLRDIFTGKITNWNAVGGPDQPIIPFSHDPQTSGTVDFVKENALAGDNLSSSVIQVKTTTESIRKVADSPGGIGYATASEVVGQSTIRPLPLSRGASQTFVSPFSSTNRSEVNQAAFADGSYPLTRRLFVIIKQDGRLDEQAGTAYVNLLLTKEGQRLVEQAGFVSIR